MNEKARKSDSEWRHELSPEQYAVCRCSATEPPFSGRWYHHDEPGTYTCACCGAPLFDSASKYDSGSGWPSFFRPRTTEAVGEREDLTHGMRRIEVRCAACDAHLGHLFPDGPAPTGLRYCINSVALDFQPAVDAPG
jgi:peptide-methionine (R)-S-oxide reductase